MEWLKRRDSKVRDGSAISIHGDHNTIVQGGRSVRASSGGSDPGVRWWVLTIVGGATAAVIAGVLLSSRGDDSTSESPSNSAESTADSSTLSSSPLSVGSDEPTCSGQPCERLFVANTIVGGRDEGVYVRSGPTENDVRRTGQFAEAVIYGICVVNEGLDVGGNARWVKAPFVFVDGDLGAGDVFADPKSYSDQDAVEHGWINSTFLEPASKVLQLPVCT
jgi:hypothetical protein